MQPPVESHLAKPPQCASVVQLYDDPIRCDLPAEHESPHCNDECGAIWERSHTPYTVVCEECDAAEWLSATPAQCPWCGGIPLADGEIDFVEVLEHPERLAWPIDCLDLSVRTFNTLQIRGVQVLWQICMLTRRELLIGPGGSPPGRGSLSRKCLADLEAKLAAHGLGIGMGDHSMVRWLAQGWPEEARYGR